MARLYTVLTIAVVLACAHAGGAVNVPRPGSLTAEETSALPWLAGSPAADIAHRMAAGVPAPRTGRHLSRAARSYSSSASATGGGAALPASVHRGMTFFELSPDVLALNASLAELAELKAINTEWVSVVIFLATDNATASTVRSSSSTASDASLITFLDAAQALGLRTLVKPIVVPHGSTMAKMSPVNPDLWFSTLTTKLLHYAAIGNAHGADAMSLGVEYVLLSGPQYSDKWTSVASGVRQVFPRAKLTYCSLFLTEWHNINWWHAVDWVGIDAYFLVGEIGQPTPSVATMVDNWKLYMQLLRNWRQKSGYANMPLVFTEVGYSSYSSVAGLPGLSPPNCTGVYEPDFSAQQRCYEALFQAVSDNADIIDTLLMFWFDNPSTPDYYVNATTYGSDWPCWFTPRGKPAYKSLQAAFASP